MANTNTVTSIQTNVDAAFERLRTWLKEREIPCDDNFLSRWMLMATVNGYHQFKNCNTRNYLYVNVDPRPFNL